LESTDFSVLCFDMPLRFLGSPLRNAVQVEAIKYINSVPVLQLVITSAEFCVFYGYVVVALYWNVVWMLPSPERSVLNQFLALRFEAEPFAACSEGEIRFNAAQLE
jgi:hypothetical protein